eukprot:128999_1
MEDDNKSDFTDVEDQDIPFTVKSDYDYSIAAIIVRQYRLIFLCIIILILVSMKQIDPYSDAFETSYSVFILFGFWLLALESVISCFCIFCMNVATVASKIILIIYLIEGICAAIIPQSFFGILFTLQSIMTDFMSIYSSCYLLYLGKIKKPLMLFILTQVYLFIFKLYSLTFSFIYIHNDIANHSTPSFAYLLIFSFPRLVLVAEIIVDKLNFIASIIYVKKENNYQNNVVKIIFIVSTLCVLFISIVLYLIYEIEHNGSELDGFYPYAMWMEDVFYWNFPIMFAVVIWMLCSRIYIYQKKILFGTIPTQL